MATQNHFILGIESSCDDTSASVLCNTKMLSNVIANQSVHEAYGGVVPELASRAHQQNIVPVIHRALSLAQITLKDLSAIAFTRGPGLMGSLLVGTSFAKGLALANNTPLIEVNHLQGHVLSHFIDEPDKVLPHPKFPFLCLLVSGGHTQILQVDAPLNHHIIGETIDDAAGEAFDKCAKVMSLPYPGGPVIDKLAQEGNPQRFSFAKPRIANLDYSFSGLKTSFLYFLRDQMGINNNFIEENKADLCASLQGTIIEILLNKLEKAVQQTNIQEVAIAGGVSANSGLRNAITQIGQQKGWNVYLPELRYTTDNAAMIAIAGLFKFHNKKFANLDATPLAQMSVVNTL
ncbi:MAG: tRNA (adenosine(37)-N6)-threonylcarbamoyltransferase complex transferase subunit TsaD [Bacteroidales bacterium]